MRELRKCEGCGKYMWAVETPDLNDNTAKRLKYCRECLEKRLNYSKTLAEIERENPRPNEFDMEERYNGFSPEERGWRKTD